MWELALSVLVPIVKWLFTRKAKRKLSDSEFVEYILAHQKMRSRASQTSTDWEDALAEAQAEMKNENPE